MSTGRPAATVTSTPSSRGPARSGDARLTDPPPICRYDAGKPNRFDARRQRLQRRPDSRSLSHPLVTLQPMELIVVVVVLIVALGAVLAVRAAVDTVVSVADQQLGTRTEAGTRELALHRDAIGDRLDAMGGELARVNELVGAMQRERSQQHGELLAGLRETLRTTGELANTANALRQALASPKARGQWGERMA